MTVLAWLLPETTLIMLPLPLFAEALDMRTNNLKESFEEIDFNSLPKEIFWIDLEIDSTTFRIKVNQYSTESNKVSQPLMRFQKTIEDMVSSIKPETREDENGWGKEDKFELLIELIKRWLSHNWNFALTEDFKRRTTVSIKNRNGHFDIRKNKWEGTDYLSGYYLEQMFRI